MAYLSLQQHSKNPENTDLIQVLKTRYLKKIADRFSIFTISLPDELIIEILSWLPVKTLLQFKTVSKSWYSIIASRRFVSKHLRNYYDNNCDSDCFLTLQRSGVYAEVNLRARFYSKSTGVYASLPLTPPLPTSLSDSEVGNETYYLSGPCNGVYYLGGDYKTSRLWNPTINDLKDLPALITKPDLPVFLNYMPFDVHGFGYDPFTRDYKVVIIKQYYWGHNFPRPDERQMCQYPPSVLVYSLKADSWKYWGDLPQYYDRFTRNETHIFVNGCLYWVAQRLLDMFKAIISFNIFTNVLQEIQVPNFDRRTKTSLGTYKGSLAFYTINDPRSYKAKSCLELWTLNDYDGCFTKKISIGSIEQYVFPLGHLKNDIVILQRHGNVVLCDPDTGKMLDIPLNDSGYQSVVVYQESLVSVNGLCQGHED